METAEATEATTPEEPAGDPAPAPVPHRMRVRLENDGIVILLAVGVILAALLLQVTPERDGVTVFGKRLPESCGIKRLGGTCPGCGLTRSFVLGVRGDPAAFRLHPAGPLLLLVLVAQIPYRLTRIVRVRRLIRAGQVDLSEEARARWWGRFQIGLVVLVFVGWFLRMALGAP